MSGLNENFESGHLLSSIFRNGARKFPSRARAQKKNTHLHFSSIHQSSWFRRKKVVIGAAKKIIMVHKSFSD